MRSIFVIAALYTANASAYRFVENVPYNELQSYDPIRGSTYRPSSPIHLQGSNGPAGLSRRTGPYAPTGPAGPTGPTRLFSSTSHPTGPSGP